MDRHIIPKDYQRKSVFRCLFFQSHIGNLRAQINIQASLKNSPAYTRSIAKLKVLSRLGEANQSITSINWNSTGEYLLSSSYGRTFTISNPHRERVLLEYETRHKPYIHALRFMPHSQDREIISCSQVGKVIHTQFVEQYSQNQSLNGPMRYSYTSRSDNIVEGSFLCHGDYAPMEICTMPNEPRSFLSGGTDGTIRFIDLRTKSNCMGTPCNLNVLIVCPVGVNAFDVAPISHYQIAVGCSDSVVHIYDRRKLSIMNSTDPNWSYVDNLTPPLQSFTVAHPAGINFIRYSPDENDLLASFQYNYSYLIDLKHSNFEGIKTLVSGYRYNLTPIYAEWHHNYANTPYSWYNDGMYYRYLSAEQRYYYHQERCRQRMRSGYHAGSHVVRSLNHRYHIQHRNPQESHRIMRRGRRTILWYEPSLEPNPSVLRNQDHVRAVYGAHQSVPNLPQQATFWGDQYVIHGSQCGYMYIYERYTGNVINCLKAKDDLEDPYNANTYQRYCDSTNVVQAVAAHPTMPLLASSTRHDRSIKLFGPVNPNANANYDTDSDMDVDVET